MAVILTSTQHARKVWSGRGGCIGFGKRVFWKRGPFRKVHFLENLEILEFLENPQTLEKKENPTIF